MSLKPFQLGFHEFLLPFFGRLVLYSLRLMSHVLIEVELRIDFNDKELLILLKLLLQFTWETFVVIDALNEFFAINQSLLVVDHVFEGHRHHGNNHVEKQDQ